MEGLLIEFVQSKLGIAAVSFGETELDIKFDNVSGGARITSIKVLGSKFFDWGQAKKIENVLSQYLLENQK